MSQKFNDDTEKSLKIKEDFDKAPSKENKKKINKEEKTSITTTSESSGSDSEKQPNLKENFIFDENLDVEIDDSFNLQGKS